MSTAVSQQPATDEPRIQEDREDVTRVAPGETPAVEVIEVTKSFGDVTVIEGITLEVPRGQIFGLIGPSGCGKTTLVHMLVGLSAPNSGTVRVYGDEPRNFGPAQRQKIGYTPQGFNLYPTLTVMENAKFVASLYGIGWRRRRRRLRDVLELLEIWDARNRLARDISGGMQRRLSLACALLHQPRILFVDEPTAGLDPVLRAKIWEHLQMLRDIGTTVVLTTQYIDEATYCDRMAILNKGRIVADGSPDHLRRQALGGEALDIASDHFGRGDIAALWQLPCVTSVQWISSNALRCSVEDIGPATLAITEALQERGTEVTSIRPYQPSFDEVFMKLVERE